MPVGKCIFLSLMLLLPVGVRAQSDCRPASGIAQYTGRYQTPDGSLMIFQNEAGKLTAGPVFRADKVPLEQKGADKFLLQGRADRSIEFVRDANGCVNSVKISRPGHEDVFLKASDAKTPLEFLSDGLPEKAAQMITSQYPSDPKPAVQIANAFLDWMPSKSEYTVRYLNEIKKRFPANAEIYNALGQTEINLGDRRAALQNFQKANELDKNNETAKAALRKLGIVQPTAAEMLESWQLPFSLSDIFAAPTAAEIKAAEDDWIKRDMSPRSVQEVASGEINLGQVKATARIISHDVRGFKHYGAIIIPNGAETGTHPVLLDLKGVSPDFFPLDLNALMSPQILGDAQGKFIYVVPSFRGEVLQFDGKEYKSEGDPTDSWDGAADDAIALLNVALQTVPQADKTRIAAFGKSRGGALAMLVGIRDKRVKQIVSWSGPADFFELMGEGNWTEREVVSEALLHRAKPADDGGQFVETFLAKAREHRQNLAQTRRLMIQSSALYHIQMMPRMQAYYGTEDDMVPPRNGRALEAALKKAGKIPPDYTVFYNEMAGHDLNTKLATPETKKFLLELLK
jgi:tetratricopeptide (TPR) repeat protein